MSFNYSVYADLESGTGSAFLTTSDYIAMGFMLILLIAWYVTWRIMGKE